MKCAKCGAMIKGDSESYSDEGYAEKDYESDDMDEMGVKDSVLAELIETMQGSVGKDLKKPAVMAIEIKKKG